MARALTGRNKVMKFEGAWHGMHDYGLWGTVPSVPSAYPHAKPDSVGVPPQAGDTVLVAPFNDAAAAVAMIDRHDPGSERQQGQQRQEHDVEVAPIERRVLGEMVGVSGAGETDDDRRRHRCEEQPASGHLRSV